MPPKPKILKLGWVKARSKEACDKFRDAHIVNGYECKESVEMEDGMWSFEAIKK